jgi:hypothetical protein
MPYVKDIQHQEVISSRKKDKEVVWIPVNRKFIAYTASIAAALIAMCILPAPLNNGRSPIHTQYASLVHFSTRDTAAETPDSVRKAKVIEPVVSAETSTPVPETVKPQNANAFHYYIIIASLPDQSSAKRTLTEFQSKGFGNSAILSSDGRYRIYANCCTDKTEAEKSLLQFRKDHPAQANAWLLRQKK